MQEVLKNLEKWDFTREYYKFENYQCEVADIRKAFLNDNIEYFLDFWKEKNKFPFFELKHPFLNDIKTRAVYNIHMEYVNFIFMIDESNKYPWIFGQCQSLIDSIIVGDKVYIISKVMQEDLFRRIPRLSQIDASNIYFRNIDFGFLLEQGRPLHYFYDQFRYFCRFDCAKSVRANNSFFVPKNSLYLHEKDKQVFLFPTGIAATQMSSVINYAKKNELVENIDRNMENFIIKDVLEGNKEQIHNKMYDITLWFTICSEHRVWVQQISGYLSIIKELLRYYKSIRVYFDGITAYEGQKIDQGDDWGIFHKIKEKALAIEGLTIEPLIGVDYREKILKCREVDYYICEAGTATLVPIRIFKKSGVVYSNSKYYTLCDPLEYSSRIKAVEPCFLEDVLMHEAALFQHVHIPWQHLFNLLAEVIGDSRIKKIEIPSLKEVILTWVFEEINAYEEKKIWYEKIYIFALIFAKANQFSIAITLIRNIFDFLSDEQKIYANEQLKLYEKLIKENKIDDAFSKQIQNLELEIQTKNQEITQTKNQLVSTKQQLDSKVKELDSKTKELSSLPIKKQTLEIKNLEQDLINKQLHTKQLEKELGYESNVLKELELNKQELIQTKNQLDFTKKQLESKTKELESKNKILSSNPNTSHPIQNASCFKGKLAYLNTLTTAKDRIHNHLSYKLGQAMIENSKSLLGYIRMPYVLSYIKDKHKQEQQQYQEAIKKNPNLKLPNLESYPNYQESLKEKECLTYKLGEAFIKASKTWYKGGYVKLWFEVRRLKGERK
ncbi:coiled-coil domain-containing protein [Helicobacter pullorum]|uniref:Sugar transferase n=1 Tax=Helicobacter pullorum TaxID=35818 RepID=A0A377Q0F1_9HELI|nr:hypothetical protein [Helicobacter pullorum]STQ87343.1 Uncharacterised protein [Helicobacter pullorum]